MLNPPITTEIIIDGNYAKLVGSIYDDSDDTEDNTTEPLRHPLTIQSKIRTQDFIQKLTNQKNNSTSYILPNNCKYIKVLPNYSKVLIIEEEPKIRTISVNMDLSSIIELHKLTGKYEEYGLERFEKLKINRNTGNPTYRFSLSMPFVIYAISLNSSNRVQRCRVFFRLHPITSFDDYLLTPALSNLDSGCNLCTGEITQKSSVHEAADEVVTRFWMNEFNKDYYSHVLSYSDVPEISDYFTWDYNTKKDPLFIFSTKWKVRENETIENVITHEVANLEYYDSKKLNLTDIINLISLEQKNSESGVASSQINSRFTSAEVLSNGISIAVGDELTINNVHYYVASFKKSYDAKDDYTETSIILEDDNGELITLDLEGDSKHEIIKSLEIKNPTSINVNGEELKNGDLVQFAFTSQIQVLEKIINSRDGIPQLKIGKDFYLLTPFLQGKIKKVDENNIYFNGERLEKGKNYFVLHQTGSIFSSYRILIYQKLSTYDNQLCFNFKDENRKDQYISMNNKTSSISSPMPSYKIFRWNDSLFTNNENQDEVAIIKNKGFSLSGTKHQGRDLSTYYDRRMYLSYSEKICNEFLSKINDSIEIKSYDFDLNFKIGEEVISIDWTKPEEMLKIKTISKFILDESKNKFNILLIDDDGNQETFEFIDIKTGNINTGKIRKVCREVNDIQVNTKAICKTKIPDFPKKDCNEIKAFIIDGVNPLVLFSNYRTLKIQKLQEFDLYGKDHPKYSKLQVTKEIKDIHLQCGDFIIAPSYGMPAVISGWKNFYTIGYPTSSHSLRTSMIPKSYIRYGILQERILKSNFMDTPLRHGFPGMFENTMVKDSDCQASII